MGFRKFRAEKIFDGTRFLEGGKVLIAKDDGSIEAIVDEADAGGDIMEIPGILSPGFVNCHCHLELSHLKGKIPEGTGLIDFVFKVVSERHHPEEEILQSIAGAEQEMIQGGITAVGDICNTSFTIAQKEKQHLRYYNFIEASGWLPSVSDTRFQQAKKLYEQFLTDGGVPPVGNSSIVPHAPYSVSERLWKLIGPFFREKVASIHNQETKWEDEFFLKGSGDFNRMYEMMRISNTHHLPTGKTSLRSYFDHLSAAKQVLLVHNSFTSQQDIEYVADRRGKSTVWFCICINANLYIERALPPVEMLRSSGCSIVIGTDSLASNHSLSIANEIRTIRNHFPQIPLEEVLTWATFNGAEALDMGQIAGSFAPGKRPGIIRFDEALHLVEKLM